MAWYSLIISEKIISFKESNTNTVLNVGKY